MDTLEVTEEEIPQYHEENKTETNNYIGIIINNDKPGGPVVLNCKEPPAFEDGMYVFHKTNGKEFRIYPGNCTVIVTNDSLDTITQ